MKRNIDFINEYGKKEFYDMCRYVQQDLALAKAQGQIGGFKVNNSKKRVKFFRENGENICLDFATIYYIGRSKLRKYINNMKDEKEKVR